MALITWGGGCNTIALITSRWLRSQVRDGLPDHAGERAAARQGTAGLSCSKTAPPFFHEAAAPQGIGKGFLALSFIPFPPAAQSALFFGGLWGILVFGEIKGAAAIGTFFAGGKQNTPAKPRYIH